MLSAIIIEDEKLAREVLISLLEQFFGNKINILGEASNIKQGVSLIQKYQPQLVFLDIQLRGLTGFDLFNHFEEPSLFSRFYLISKHLIPQKEVCICYSLYFFVKTL